MSKNKNGKNAFYYFMLDWKKQEELKGRTFQRGLKDVQADAKCSDDWKNLPVETKILYKEKEKNNKWKMKINKKTCLGESFEEVEKSELKNAEFMDEMKRCVSTIIAEAARNRCVEKLLFHVVHVNHLYSCICDDNEIVYYPVEVGIAEFSLEKGIIRTYHKIVNSKVKMGYASAALEHSKNTHQIPRNFGESDYGVVYKEIIKFLESSRCNGKLPPLYSLYYKEDVKFPVLSGLELLANFQKESENFIIYSFEELFINLRNMNIDDDDDLIKFDNVIVSIKLTEDPYDYKKNLACQFHRTSGGENYCSKSIVQRWIFVLCSFTCPLFYIDLIPGSHTPVEDENIRNIIQLNHSFKKMNLAKNGFHNENQPKHPSERTWADEEKRRSEAMAHPIHIVDHSVISSTQNAPVALQKPMDPPFSKPITSYTDDCTEIVYDERDFSSIGRGSWIKNHSSDVRRIRRPQNRE